MHRLGAFCQTASTGGCRLRCATPRGDHEPFAQCGAEYREPSDAPLLPTPRSAKKMLNLYRLMRIAMPERELMWWLGDEKGGGYQVALLELPLLPGRPLAGRAVLEDA